MVAHGGKYAVVNNFDTLRGWTIVDNAPAKPYAASNTGGGHGRRKGIRVWTGQVQCYGAVPVVMPGETFAFQGYGSPTTDVEGADGYVYSGNAIVDQVAIVWNFATQEPLGYTLGFSGDLALTIASAAPPEDVSIPNPPQVCDTKLLWGATELLDWTQATLTIRAGNTAFVNSSTCIAGVVWTGRRPGNIDWTVSINQECDERGVATAPAIGAEAILKMYTSATEFWQLKWGQIEGYGSLAWNRETAAIAARTIGIGMQGSDGATLGNIILPDTTLWWGTADV